MVQLLRLHAFTAGGTGSISGQGTKILHVIWLLMSSSVTAGVWAFLCVCARLDHGVPSLASQQSACILGLAFCSAV